MAWLVGAVPWAKMASRMIFAWCPEARVAPRQPEMLEKGEKAVMAAKVRPVVQADLKEQVLAAGLAAVGVRLDNRAVRVRMDSQAETEVAEPVAVQDLK
jgi:protein-disulfide isomerase